MLLREMKGKEEFSKNPEVHLSNCISAVVMISCDAYTHWYYLYYRYR